MRLTSLILLLALCTSCVAQLNWEQTVRKSWLATATIDTLQTCDFAANRGVESWNPMVKKWVNSKSLLTYGAATAAFVIGVDWGISKLPGRTFRTILYAAAWVIESCAVIHNNREFHRGGIPLFIPVFSKRF